MSALGGARNRGREDRFYSPPAMRKFYQEQQQQQQPPPPLRRQSKLQKASKPKSKPPSMVSEKELESDDCSSSTNTVPSVCNSLLSPPGTSNLTNLDRFLEHTTPIVPAQYFSKTSMRQWKTSEDEFHPYFVLGDLWESFKEWSAYGAGVPLVLNGSDSVVQYYVPFLSAIQLYIDPSKPSMSLRRPGEESDADSSRETSSDGGSDCAAERGANRAQGARSQQNNMHAMAQSFNRLSVDESEISNPPGLTDFQLTFKIFEYFERDTPFSREPLADKIAVLASRFPQLKTCRSCDLTPASWISVAWYPIYRIPTGPTLQNLDACFLTFHSLSTPFTSSNNDSTRIHVPTARELHSAGMPLKLLLPIFGLASYKFKVSVWNPDGVQESQKANSLLRVADNWLHRLRVNHPDYKFFVSHN